jgi:hypothetical protein
MSMLGRCLLAAAALCSATLLSTTTPAQPAKKFALGVLIHGVKPKFALGEEVRLRAKLNWRGPKATFSYRWSTVIGPSLPYNADTRSDTLVLPKGELSPGAHYQVRLKVTAEYELVEDEDEAPTTVTTTAQSEVKFVVNEPPSGGRCDIDIKWRGVAGAAVTISAPGWTDDDRVQYRYFLLRNGKPTLVYNWSQQKSTSTATLARSGDTLQARCEIRDELGDGLTKTSKEVIRRD